LAISVRPEVEVIGRAKDGKMRAGSGVFLAGRLVLTAFHIVESPEDDVEVHILALDGNTYNCETVWSSIEADRPASLLKVTDVEWNPDSDFAPISFGRIQGGGIINCEIVGFPAFSNYRDEEMGRFIRDTVQISGVITPLTNARSGRLSISVQPPSPRAKESYIAQRSAWAGFSGAPVQCQGHLVGMVVSSPSDSSLNAVRLERLAENSRFIEIVEKEIKGKITFNDVSRADSFADTVNSVIDGVATVDSSNTQQVAALELALSKAYYERVLAQARSSFISALVSAGVGLMFFLAAISVSLVTGKLNAALISTVSGAIIEVISGLNFWLYSQTSAQLDAFHLRIERMQRFLLANSVTTSVQDPDQKDKVISELVDTIAKSVVEMRNARTPKPQHKNS
jgi:Trypsin-like peptidase domain